MTRIYSIGHSNLSSEQLLHTLEQAEVKMLVDVRARPRTRHNPQFDQLNLRAAAERQGMVYQWQGQALGGMRSVQENSPHIALRETGLRSYADYMHSDNFACALQALQAMAAQHVLAIMCAERQPLQCHRSLIADALTLQGYEVVHLFGDGGVQVHELRPELRCESATLVYDRNHSLSLDL